MLTLSGVFPELPSDAARQLHQTQDFQTLRQRESLSPRYCPRSFDDTLTCAREKVEASKRIHTASLPSHRSRREKHRWKTVLLVARVNVFKVSTMAAHRSSARRCQRRPQSMDELQISGRLSLGSQYELELARNGVHHSKSFDNLLVKARRRSVKLQLQRATTEAVSTPSREASNLSSSESNAFKLAESVEAAEESYGNDKCWSALDSCERCRGMNFQSLRADGGYQHSSLADLFNSAEECDFCKLLWRHHLDVLEHWTLERYRVVLRMDVEIERLSEYHDLQCFSQTLNDPELRMTTVDTKPYLGDEWPDVHVTGYGLSNRYEDHEDTGRPMDVRCETLAGCFTEEHDPAVVASVPWMRQLGPNTASEPTFDVARGWLHQCLSQRESLTDFEHPSWTTEEIRLKQHVEEMSAEVPARLIDLGQRPIRLVETTKDDRYATLSYCWGKFAHTPWVTTCANLSMRLHCLQRERLPLTLRDALQIAERLGIRYLWVDALCIVQDDEGDWASQAAKMGGIYAGSVVTIAAL